MKKNHDNEPASYGGTSSAPGRHCPFVANPFDVCYVSNINSQNIDPAIHYCGSHFAECEIFRNAINGERA